MIEVALAAGIAAFAVTTAVVHTKLFAWYRNWGTWASRQRWWLRIPHLPVIASHCAVCFSFWAALPFAILELPGWGAFWTVWPCTAGIAMLLSVVADALNSIGGPSIESIVEEHLLTNQEAEPPSPFTAEAYNQTGDDPS